MGIKGIYKELGPGKRISLSKLAADSLESTDRPYRIAIDFAIWHFQTQAAQGGTNPALRTLFYRLVRLLGTPIQPIFVFDGPKKPLLKRNKRSGQGDGATTAAAKYLIRLFGFPTHDAPGEGEAECAFLQRHGIVDAVLSEDVDTIMFGCTKTLRNWSSEGKASTAPTHVSLYDVDDMALGDLGLDREGMVLVALMSGGDYLPDGIPGCGIKVACEAAKAGFGKSVCRLKVSDKDSIQAWRDSLQHELQTNEKGYFKTKHKALKIPQDFPNIEVLRYYTHPVVSPESNIAAIRQKMEQKQTFHLAALREFTRETFDWDYRIGAVKFIRVLGQAMLVHNMANSNMVETQHIKRISGRRTHFSTDGTPELRLAYVPEEVVPIDLAKEVDEIVNSGRTGLALNSDDEFDVLEETPSVNAPKLFDVSKPDLAWVLEGLVKKSASGVFQEWQLKEQAKVVRRSPAKTKKKKGITKALKGSDMPRGSLDKYVTATKAALASNQDASKAREPSLSPLKSLARPKAKPSISKQSSPSPTRSPKTTTAIEVIDSSPVVPRLSRRQPDAIYISSSPPASVSSPPASSTSLSSSFFRAVPKLQLSSEAPESIRSILQASHCSKGVKTPLQRPGQRQESKKSSSILKQSSMDLFLSKSENTTTEKQAILREEEGGEESNSDSDLESISSLARLVMPIQQASVEETAAAGRGKSSSKRSEPSPRKKLSRARASGSDFFEEAELVDEERNAEVNTELGRKGTAVRWSDVSIIDLTGADN